jgi:hypothetical protein
MDLMSAMRNPAILSASSNYYRVFPEKPSAGARARARRALLFDACQIGVVLRTVVFVEAVVAIAALFVVPRWANGWCRPPRSPAAPARHAAVAGGRLRPEEAAAPPAAPVAVRGRRRAGRACGALWLRPAAADRRAGQRAVAGQCAWPAPCSRGW